MKLWDRKLNEEERGSLDTRLSVIYSVDCPTEPDVGEKTISCGREIKESIAACRIQMAECCLKRSFLGLFHQVEQLSPCNVRHMVLSLFHTVGQVSIIMQSLTHSDGDLRRCSRSSFAELFSLMERSCSPSSASAIWSFLWLIHLQEEISTINVRIWSFLWLTHQQKHIVWLTHQQKQTSIIEVRHMVLSVVNSPS